jgi:hypothetical protein
MAKDALTYQTICPGIEAGVADGYVFLKLATDRTKGSPSASGKMTITAKTARGFMDIPGAEGFRINLNAGYSNKGA